MKTIGQIEGEIERLQERKRNMVQFNAIKPPSNVIPYTIQVYLNHLAEHGPTRICDLAKLTPGTNTCGNLIRRKLVIVPMWWNWDTVLEISELGRMFVETKTKFEMSFDEKDHC